MDHSKDEFARAHTHINGIEAFWGLAKTALPSSKAWQNRPSISTSKKRSGDQIIELPKKPKPCYDSQENILSTWQDPLLDISQEITIKSDRESPSTKSILIKNRGIL